VVLLPAVSSSAQAHQSSWLPSIRAIPLSAG
jgi:hypothetical protein